MIFYILTSIVFAGLLLLVAYTLKLVRQKNRMIALLSAQNESILEAKNELNTAKLKAEESDRLKSAFLANMSHEIRTPLNAIMGFSSLIQDAEVDDDERSNFLGIIHSNSTKLLSLMDEIFNIAQIETGLLQMTREPCHINEMLTSLVTFFNMEKGLSGKDDLQIRMFKANRDAGFAILTDEKKLRQALYNLVENAIKYTNQGSVEIGYNLRETSRIEFYVKDTGVGFPQEKMDILFQRFRQADDSSTRQYGGLGLGLTLSQKFVELMGGTMRAESTPGVGSVFYIELPYEKAE